MLRGRNEVELGFGMCEFYERIVGGLAGEVWVDILHRKMPVYMGKTVENTPLYICKKIRHFLRSADIRGIRANKAGLN